MQTEAERGDAWSHRKLEETKEGGFPESCEVHSAAAALILAFWLPEL